MQGTSEAQPVPKQEYSPHAPGAVMSQGPSHHGEQHHNSAPASQVPGHPSFRRQRASRACEVGYLP